MNDIYYVSELYFVFLFILFISRLGDHVYYVWWVHGSMASNKVVRIELLGVLSTVMCRTTMEKECYSLQFHLQIKRNQGKYITRRI